MPTDKVSRPFEYTGYSDKTHRGYRRISTYIGMSDGAQIAADIYLPDGFIGAETPPASFPVLVVLTPYKRAIVDPLSGDAIPHILKRPGEHVGGMEEFGGDPAGLPCFGYAIVVADTRNNGASYGPATLTFGWRYQQDMGEVIDWVDTQDWCDGNVGMVGGSHYGWTQLAAASRKPKALKAIMPAVVPLESFTAFFPGGIAMQGIVDKYLSEEVLASVHATAAKISAPVDDIPVPKPMASGAAVSVPGFDFAKEPFIDVEAGSGERVKDICANLLKPISEFGVPIYNLGGWFDGGARGTCQIYGTLAKTNPSRLAMFPGYHGLIKSFIHDEFGQPVPDLITERRRFFDHYLRGVDNGIDSEPPVLINVMPDEGWRSEQEWPLAREHRELFYADAGNKLSVEKGYEGRDRYDVRLDHDRRYGKNLSGRWVGMIFDIPPEGAPDMTRLDEECLTYTSTPLIEAKEVTGHPIVRLWVSSTANDGDFYAFLEDVDPNGRVLMISEGQLRSGFADLHDPNSMTDTDLEIKPKLPWHGFRRQDYRSGILADGAVVELVIDLAPLSWVFKKGHSIRLSVSCANWPDFALNPALSPENNPKSEANLPTQVFIHRGGIHATSIDLPCIPRQP